jgi:hypothetical protein
MNLGTIIQMAGTPAVGCSDLLGVLFTLQTINALIAWSVVLIVTRDRKKDK